MVDAAALEKLVEVGTTLEQRKGFFEKYGGLQGIAKELKTDLEAGISAAEAPAFKDRRAQFTANVIPQPPPRSLISLIMEGLQDKTLIMLCIAG